MALSADHGLATLEWLLVAAAAASLAAALAAPLQAAVDRQTNPGASIATRVWELDNAAAFIEHDARQQLQADPLNYDETAYAQRCRNLAVTFADTVAAAAWRAGGRAGGPVAPDLPRCEVTLR